MIDFKGRRVEKDIFLSYIYWHLAYPLSNGNLGEMMTERESWVDHQIFIARFENSRQALEAILRKKRKHPVDKGWQMEGIYIKSDRQ